MKRRILALLASIVIGTLVAECAIRLAAPQLLQWDTSVIWEPADGVGWRHRPNVDVLVNTGERDARIITDAARHRVGAVHGPEADVRILAVGDSMVEAVQVDYEQTMTTLLARSLSASLGRVVEVVNAGIGGWDPNQYLAATRAELASARYDLVITFLYLENDIIERRVDGYRPTMLAQRRNVLTTQLSRHSHLFIYLYGLSQLRSVRSGTRAHLLTTAQRSHRASPAWSVTAGILADLAAAAESARVPAVFVLLPPVHYIDARLLPPLEFGLGVDAADIDVRQPAALISAELAARGLTVFDATDDLQRAFDGGERELYGRIDRHFAPAGHRVLARFLAPPIQAALQARH